MRLRGTGFRWTLATVTAAGALGLGGLLPTSSAQGAVRTAATPWCIDGLAAGNFADRLTLHWRGGAAPGTIAKYTVSRLAFNIATNAFDLVRPVAVITAQPGDTGGIEYSYTDRGVSIPNQPDYRIQATTTTGKVSSVSSTCPMIPSGLLPVDMVYSAGRPGSNHDLLVAGALYDGGETWTVDQDQIDPTFSPDGRWIAYASGDVLTPYTIMLRRADGLGTPRVVAQTAARDLTQPSWSPDGHRIAFTSRMHSTDRTDLGVVDVFTGTQALVPDSVDLADPSWLTDGRLVAQGQRDVDALPVNLVDYPSGARTPIPGTESGIEPTASHDGKRILYVHRVQRDDGVHFSLLSTTVGGSKLTVRPDSLTAISSPRWQRLDALLNWVEHDPGTDHDNIAWATPTGADYHASTGHSYGEYYGSAHGIDVREPDTIGFSDYTSDPRSNGGYDHWPSDVMAVDQQGTLWLYPGTGEHRVGFDGPFFKPRTKLGGGWSGVRSIIAPGDLSSDGKADLLAIDAGHHLILYRGNGKRWPRGRHRDRRRLDLPGRRRRWRLQRRQPRRPARQGQRRQPVALPRHRIRRPRHPRLRRPHPARRWLELDEPARRPRRLRHARPTRPAGPRHQRGHVALPRHRQGRLQRPQARRRRLAEPARHHRRRRVQPRTQRRDACRRQQGHDADVRQPAVRGLRPVGRRRRQRLERNASGSRVKHRPLAVGVAAAAAVVLLVPAADVAGAGAPAGQAAASASASTWCVTYARNDDLTDRVVLRFYGGTGHGTIASYRIYRADDSLPPRLVATMPAPDGDVGATDNTWTDSRHRGGAESPPTRCARSPPPGSRASGGQACRRARWPR